jgi:hypothetical protein
MNQDQTVIGFLAWSAALPAESKSALVSRKAGIIRVFIEDLLIIERSLLVIIEFSYLSDWKPLGWRNPGDRGFGVLAGIEKRFIAKLLRGVNKRGCFQLRKRQNASDWFGV